MPHVCKYCNAELPSSGRRVVFACRSCRHKHYADRYRERCRERNSRYYAANRDDFAAKYAYRTTHDRKRHQEYIEKNRRSLAGRHAHGKAAAKRRGLEWSLTKEQHADLLKVPCDYCGEALNPTGCGLDRKDSAKGYIPGNVVPCCKQCNRIKCEMLSHDEMRVAMHAVLALRRSRHLRAV